MSSAYVVDMQRAAFALLLTTLFGSGCAFEVPAVVDGLVQGGEFSIRDDSPVVRPQHDGVQLVVMADEVLGELRIVQIRLPASEELLLDEPMPVGAGALEVTATFGDVEAEHRSDGVRVLSTTSSTTVTAIDGSVTLASVNGVLAGTLEVTLEDGGSLKGEFTIAR